MLDLFEQSNNNIQTRTHIKQEIMATRNCIKLLSNLSQLELEISKLENLTYSNLISVDDKNMLLRRIINEYLMNTKDN